MKRFTDLVQKIPWRNVGVFLRDTGIFLALMLILYLYLMHADLSTAPKFVYAQF
jgi:hypothetical protein